MINREDELRNNLRDANEFLGEMVSHRNNLKGYYGGTVMVLNYNKICDIISMITDYIGYIYGDLQSEMDKRYCDHDQDALMEIAVGKVRDRQRKAIDILNSLKNYYNDKNVDDDIGYVGFDDEDNEALDMAIKALERESEGDIND